MGVEAAGIGEDPDAGSAKQLRLRAQGGLGTLEGHPVGTDAQDGHPPRSKPENLALETTPAEDELSSGKLVGPGRRAGRDIRQAEPQGGQAPVFGGGEAVRGKPGGVQRGPEAVAGACEVMADARRGEAGVDAAEEDREIRGDDVAQPEPRAPT
jgi:hypothetical protein